MPKKSIVTEQKKKELYQALEEAMPLTYACDIIGIPRRTVYDYMSKDNVFRTQIELAKAKAIRGLVKLTAKQNGAWKLLKNLGKEEFKECDSLELSGKDGEALTLIVKDYRGKDEPK